MAIFLPPISRDGIFLSNVFELLFLLALALQECSKKFEQPEAVKYSIDYLRFLRESTLDSFGVSRNLVVTSLVQGLGIQVEAGDGDGTRNIKEMVALCRELLITSNLSAFPSTVFISLNKASDAEFNHGIPIELLDEVVECLRDAVKACPPNSFPVLVALVQQLSTRFDETYSLDDYEEAMALLENILDPNRPGECPDSVRGLASTIAIQLAFSRCTCFKNPEYLEVAISRLRAELSSPSIDEVHRFQYSEMLSMLVKERFEDYNLSESLEEANSNSSQVVSLLPSQTLEKSGMLLTEIEDVKETYSMTALQQKIRYLEELLSITPPGTEGHKDCHGHLADWYESKFCRTDDISDINESIKYARLALDATHANDPWRINPLFSLHDILLLAFERSGEIGYLDESIVIGYDILKSKIYQDSHFLTVQLLVSSLRVREKLLGRTEDHHEAIRLILLVINTPFAGESERFRLSCQWAILARSIDHPTTLTAYKCAMSLMQTSLSFAPTVSVQHTCLVAMGENCQTMPLDYASYLIHLGQFEKAVETLEQGRALLWSEMRGLRIPVAQLIKEDSLLAQRFAQMNQELEALTIALTPSGRPEVEDGVRDGTDPFGRLLIKRKKLVDERDALISQIQSHGQPGLDELLRVPSYTTLRSAASRGPVVIINHCKWSSDIMIIFHSYLPCSIPTDETFFARTNELRDEFVEARKRGLDSKEYQEALCSVLKGLYELVGEPVIKRLRLLGVPEQSRIWWCPTSAFCSLPLHAMGPIPSSEPGKPRYFSDLYIPSYTPSLSALIESRKASPQTLEKPSLLLVAQPDDSLPGVTGEITVILERALKAHVAVTDLVSSRATPSTVLEGLRGRQFAHFACHGVLETGKPFDASFKLHRGSRLTLLEIIQSRLPDAEFAFLSCCHTAEITAESVSDEALHLTAAMQYSGFRSVVGTMWAMADTDGRDLAKNFYKSLFSRRDSTVPYYERSAEALRDATQKLRGKRGISLERWVNFVHYGA
jgi:CHAT domain-containing protein